MKLSSCSGVALVLFLSSSSAAQDTLLVADSPVCPGCTVVLETGPSLGDADGDGALRGPPIVAIDAQGRFVVLVGVPDELPRLFSPSGHYLRSFGRIGEGPEEFLYPIRIAAGLADSLVIFDQQAGRLSVLDPLTLRSARVKAIDLGYLNDALVTETGDIVINAGTFDREGAGWAIQVYGDDDKPIRRLEPYAFKDPREYRGYRFLARTPDGFWVIPQTRDYRMTLYANDGTAIRVLRREPDWFFSREILATVNNDNRPVTEVRGAFVDDRGLLWVILMDADPEWRDGLSKPFRAEGGEEAFAEWEFDKVYDTIVEVIDPDTGRLLVHERIDPFIWQVVGPGIVSRSRQDDLGWWFAEISFLRLRPRDRR